MEKNLENKGSRKGCRDGLVGCSTILFIFIILGVIINFTFCGKSDIDKDKDMTSTIITIAQQEVEKRLKSPSSAKFPWASDAYNIKETVSDNEGYKRYYVSSYVDSDNSFGAKIRANYIGEFDIDNDGNYIVIDINIME